MAVADKPRTVRRVRSKVQEDPNDAGTIMATTKNGKDITVVYDKVLNMYKIQFTSGGQLPDFLTGMYTSESAATHDINVYLNSK